MMQPARVQPPCAVIKRYRKRFTFHRISEPRPVSLPHYDVVAR